jgi:hypothetical protein
MEAWYEGLVDKRLIHVAERLAKTREEQAKVKELVMMGALRKRNFDVLRKELLALCETLRSHREEEKKKRQK